jgi:hypothetical protein
MVLEEQVVLVSRAADATKHIAAHEFVDIGAETVNDLLLHK